MSDADRQIVMKAVHSFSTTAAKKLLKYLPFDEKKKRRKPNAAYKWCNAARAFDDGLRPRQVQKYNGLARQGGLTYHRWAESRSAPALQSRGACMVIGLRKHAGVGGGREKRVWRAQAKLRGRKRTRK